MATHGESSISKLTLYDVLMLEGFRYIWIVSNTYQG